MNKNKYRAKPLTWNDYRVYMLVEGDPQEWSRTVNCSLRIQAEINAKKKLAFTLNKPESEITVIRVVQLTHNQREW